MSFGRGFNFNNNNRCGLRAKVEGGWEGSIPVPLTGVSINAKLLNFTAHVTVVQKYVNKEEGPIECEYIFPVEEEAAVVDFKAELEGRELVSKIKKREEAKKDYDEAVAGDRTAFLVDSTRDDMLDIQIGHLSPGAGCTISLSYIFEVPLENGKTRLTIPTTISPKYIPFPDGSPESRKIASIKYDFRTPAKLEFSLDTCMRSRIQAVTSPSHKLVTEGGSEQNEFGFYTATSKFESTTTDMDKDIVVLVDCEDPNKSIIFVEECEESRVMMVSMVPKLEMKSDPELDVVFLIDCSGSMQGSSIQLAKEAINYLLHSLPPSVNFNIVRFGSRYVKLFPESRQYNDATLLEAKTAMDRLEADLGGTEILRPLTELLTESTRLPRRIFVLTDGSVSNSAECIRVTRKHSDKNRVFTLGIGSAADRHLVKGLARAGLGTFEFTVEGEMMAPKVLKQLKNCLQPNLQDVKIDWGTESPAGGFDQVPEPLPPLYNGNRLQIFRMFDKDAIVPKKIKISASIPSLCEKYEETLTTDTSFINGKLLHQMYARKLIQDLTENMNVVDKNGKVNETEEKEIESVITKFSLKYQLMSKYTSFVAVDTKATRSDLKMVHRDVHSQVPGGFGGFGGGPPMMMMCQAAPMRRMKQMCGGGARQQQQRIRNAAAPAPPPQTGGGFFGATAFGSAAPPPPPPASSNSAFGGGVFGSAAPSGKKAMSFGAGVFGSAAKPPAESSNSPMLFGSALASCPISPALFGSPSAEHVDSVQTEPEDDMSRVLKLVSLQRADGSFRRDACIFSISKLSEQEMDSIRGQVDEDRFVSMLVVVILEEMFPGSKDCWEMLVDKTRRWLTSNPVPEDVKVKILKAVKRD